MKKITLFLLFAVLLIVGCAAPLTPPPTLNGKPIETPVSDGSVKYFTIEGTVSGYPSLFSDFVVVRVLVEKSGNDKVRKGNVVLLSFSDLVAAGYLSGDKLSAKCVETNGRIGNCVILNYIVSP